MRTNYMRILLAIGAIALLAGCGSSRFVSADRDLEGIYLGKSYYDVVSDFGYPDASYRDNEGGTRITYNAVSLEGTRAAVLYSRHVVRNARTHEEGCPKGSLVFYFNPTMKCYAINSTFERVSDKAEAAERIPEPTYVVKPRVPRSFDFPAVKSRSPFAKVVTIERLEIERDKTVVYFSYCDRTPAHRPLYDKGLSINKDVYICDLATGKHYKLQSTEGITLYPEYTPFAHNRGGYDVLVYSLTFEALPPDVKAIDIVEPGAEGFNFYGIDVISPINFREMKKLEDAKLLNTKPYEPEPEEEPESEYENN